MASTILLLEDDEKLGGQIAQQLRMCGFEVTWWREGRRLDADEAKKYELVILDLMLPGVYGMDVLKHLRTISDKPVLVLSARVDTADKVRALKLGADDYLTKPFWPDELIERVKARLRRPQMARADQLVFGELELDLGARRVMLAGQEVPLTRLEFEVLAALARRPGDAVARGWFIDNLFDASDDGTDRTLDVHVSRLRKKLGRPELVQTVWGVGYRLGVSR